MSKVIITTKDACAEPCPVCEVQVPWSTSYPELDLAKVEADENVKTVPALMTCGKCKHVMQVQAFVNRKKPLKV